MSSPFEGKEQPLQELLLDPLLELRLALLIGVEHQDDRAIGTDCREIIEEGADTGLLRGALLLGRQLLYGQAASCCEWLVVPAVQVVEQRGVGLLRGAAIDIPPIGLWPQAAAVRH